VPVPAPTPDGRGPFSDGERATLGPEVVRALAQLHAVDWQRLGLAFLGDPGGGRATATRELARWERRLTDSGLPADPAVTAAVLWLRAHVPSCDETTLVHGDYRLGNFLVERDGARARLTGVLDWEMVHLGDPLEDLAWCASPLWRAGTDLASALLPPDEMSALYAAASGRAVDADRMRFYDVLTLVKMIAIMQTGIRAFNDGRTSDLRMAIFDHQLPYLLVVLAMTLDFFGGGAA
jgi:aminoglycoside phosphotransferase (APT) family kinase protein